MPGHDRRQCPLSRGVTGGTMGAAQVQAAVTNQGQASQMPANQVLLGDRINDSQPLPKFRPVEYERKMPSKAGMGFTENI